MTKTITLRRPKLMIPLILALVASAILGGVVAANGRGALHVDAFKFDSEGTIVAVLDPGVTTVDAAGNTTIRGLILQQVFTADSKYLDGSLATITVNADLDPAGTGPDFGTGFVEVDNGKGFQGTFANCGFIGTFVNSLPFEFESVCIGTGDFQGLILMSIGTRDIPGGPSTVDQYVIEDADLEGWGHNIHAHGDD